MSIRNPFRKDTKLVSVIDACQQGPTNPWAVLQGRGYSILSKPAADGKREYVFTLHGKPCTEWSKPLTVDEKSAMCQQWAAAELAKE